MKRTKSNADAAAPISGIVRITDKNAKCFCPKCHIPLPSSEHIAKCSPDAAPAVGQHTPGPWKVSEWVSQSVTDDGEVHTGVDTAYPTGQLNDGSRSIVSCTGTYYTRNGQKNRMQAIAVNRANARLIAAAPDLLEALRGLFDLVPLSAEGPAPDAKIVTNVKYWRKAFDNARSAIAKAERGQG